MRQVEKWIPDAVEVLLKDGFCEEGTLKVSKEYKGYFASFGAAVIQSGLLPAVVFFENEQSSAKAERIKVPKAILHLLRKKYDDTVNPPLHKHEKLSDYLLNSTQAAARDIDMISKAAIALKIGLRTFNLKDKNEAA